MKEKDINHLLAKLRTGQLDPEEERMLKNWLHQLNNEGDAGVSDAELLDLRQEMWSHIQAEKSPSLPHVIQPTRRLWLPLTAAALLLTALGIGLYTYLGQQSQPTRAEALLASAMDGDQAFLTLSDGRTISLSDTLRGELAEQAGIKIIKTDSDELTYVALGSAASQGELPRFNTITTPKGVQYRVILPDGSKVWLNSASSLTYPNRLLANERRVQLVGEAYFEVAKNDKLPFVVQSKGQDVTVLGTHFNVNSYPDEARTLTTLLEGAVKVTENTSKNPEARKSILLSPNQQSTLLHGSKNFQVHTIDPLLATAWKDGYFHFDNLDIQTIMRTISRWYRIDIDYVGPVPDTKFSGRISRSNGDLADVLAILESTGMVHFKIEPVKNKNLERRVTISK